MCVGLVACLGAGGHLNAQQEYPTRPVTIIVPNPAGGATDIIARLNADELAGYFKQPFVVENRAGGNNVVGLRAVAQAAPDGYTLLAATEAALVTLSVIDPKFPFNPLTDFTPLSLTAEFQFILLANAKLPVRSVKELVVYAAARPGELSYGSNGAGTSAHIAMELLKRRANIDLVHVPYKSSSQVLTDLMGGHLSAQFQSYPVAQSLLKDPNIRALAVTGTERIEELPDVPTMREAGFPDFQFSSWVGLLGPAGLPGGVKSKLSATLSELTRRPEMQKQIKTIAFQPRGLDAVEFEKVIKEGLVRTKRVSVEAGIVGP
jgi:tripartite-type tricarboxylate transporter receptor subunit TctC